MSKIGIDVSPSYYCQVDDSILEECIELSKKLGVNVHLREEINGGEIITIDSEDSVEGIKKRW